MKKLFAISALVLSLSSLVLAQTTNAPNALTYNISTFAGSGTSSLGDGSQANNGVVFSPNDVVVDKAGNIYIADTGQNRVRKIDTNGVITTIVGTGRDASNNAGIGNPLTTLTQPGQGTATAVNGPTGLALSPDEKKLYVAERANHKVKVLDLTTGVVSNFANAVGGADYSGDGQLAIKAYMRNPSAVAVDSKGNVYIADRGNNRIRKVDINTGIITTAAGTGPTNADGNFNPTPSDPTGIGDGGKATKAKLNRAEGVAIDAYDNIFIADTNSNRIRKVDASTGIITTIAGVCLTPACVGGVQSPNGDSSITVGGLTGACPTTTLANGAATATAGVPANQVITTRVPPTFIDVVQGTRGTLNAPRGLRFSPAGDLYISDTGSNRIRVMKAIDLPNGRHEVTGDSILSTFAGSGTATGGAGDGRQSTSATFNGPRGIGFDAAGNAFIADAGNDRIRQVDGSSGLVSVTTGINQFRGDGGAASLATFSNPRGLAVDNAGNVLVGDSGNNRVRRIAKDGSSIDTLAGTGTSGFTGDGGLAAAARLSNPSCVAIDSANSVYIADQGNNRVRKVDAYGIITTLAGGGTSDQESGIPAVNARLSAPRCVAADKAGTIYIADSGNHVIRKVTPDGTISTVAGTFATSGSAGDGGPATDALFNTPQGIAVDANNRLFITDTSNHATRVVDLVTGTIINVTGRPNDASSDTATNAAFGVVSVLPAESIRQDTPIGIASDDFGNVFIADSNNDRVERIVPVKDDKGVTTFFISTIAGTGSVAGEDKLATGIQIINPRGVAIDKTTGVIYVTDVQGKIYKLTPNTK